MAIAFSVQLPAARRCALLLARRHQGLKPLGKISVGVRPSPNRTARTVTRRGPSLLTITRALKQPPAALEKRIPSSLTTAPME